MISEVLIATISMQAGRKLDQEIKDNKKKYGFSSTKAYKREEYVVPQWNILRNSECINSINDLIV